MGAAVLPAVALVPVVRVVLPTTAGERPVVASLLMERVERVELTALRVVVAWLRLLPATCRACGERVDALPAVVALRLYGDREEEAMLEEER